MRNFLSYSKILILACTISAVSCKKEDVPAPPPTDTTSNGSGRQLGYEGDDELSTIPTTPNVGYDESNLPSKVDLTSKFPPVGDQGQYGTCVAWAVAYNYKTALNGMEKGFGASQLASPANQFSPRDLFTAIPDAEKGNDCNGTNFTTALDILQTRGVASLQTVPYTSLGDCSQSNVQSNWTAEAGNNKIKYWRKINASVTDIKKNIANNIPVLLAAKLSDNFMTWNSDNVLSSNTTYTKVGQHAYHALVIAGYDDSKGAGGAFKVINSWGKYWGTSGYIWVDYNFLINQFCTTPDGDKPLFIASNDDGNVNPPTPTPSRSGVDLAPWVFSDANSDGGNERELIYNFYNIGTQTASASANWSVYYVYFNAYDANDYDVLFYDDFNTSLPSNDYECPTTGSCTFNYDIPAGGDLATAIFNKERIRRTYVMPNITGDYYLALITDAGDVFAEEDEMNNIFYTSILPTSFEDGYAERSTSGNGKFNFSNELPFNRQSLKKSKFSTVVTPQFKNAYTPKEILSFFKKEKNNGRLQKKINNYLQRRSIQVLSAN